MLKNLIEKRSATLAELEGLVAKVANEKREYTTEERTNRNELKLTLESLNEQIKDLEEIEKETQRKLSTDSTVKTFNITKEENKDENIIKRTNSEFINYLKGNDIADEFRGKNGGFKFSNEYFEQRATVVSSDAKLDSKLTLPVSIIEKGLVLGSLGAPAVQFVSGGGFKAPYLSSAPATYNTEDNANADQTWSASADDVVPVHSSASYELSGQYLKQISQQSVDMIMASLQNRILQGLEKRAINKIVADAGTIYTGTTATTYYAAVLATEAAVENTSGYLFSKASGQRAKQAKIDAASGFMVYQNGMVNGAPAATSSILTGNTFVSGDFSHVSMFIWDGIEVNLMQDVTAKRKGNYILIADAFSDVAANPAAFAVYINTQNLGLNN
jgi:hypothetical protein